MIQKQFSAEQIVKKLRQAEVLLPRGQVVAHASSALGITEQTFYRWQKEDGGMRIDPARKLRGLKGETPSRRSFWRR